MVDPTQVWPPGATAGPRVQLTNPDKVLYPATGTTKAEVFDYYINIAEVMVPHIAGPTGHPQALAQRRRRTVVLRKAARQLRAGLVGPSQCGAPVGNHDLPDHQQHARAGVDRAAGGAGGARAAMALRRRKTRAGHAFGVRPGSRRGRGDVAAVRGRARRQGSDGRYRADDLSADQRQQGSASVRPPRRSDQLAGRGGVGQTRCAATGKGDAQAGDRDHDQEPAGRQGVLGLEPEQRIEDHHRAVLAARPGTPHRRRAAHVGRNRGP